MDKNDSIANRKLISKAVLTVRNGRSDWYVPILALMVCLDLDREFIQLYNFKTYVEGQKSHKCSETEYNS